MMDVLRRIRCELFHPTQLVGCVEWSHVVCETCGASHPALATPEDDSP